MKSGGQMLRAVIVKEFRHIFRDRVSFLLLFLMPAFLVLMLGYALSFQVNHHDIYVYNPVHSTEAERLFARLDANPLLQVCGHLERMDEIEPAFSKGNTRAVVMYDNDGLHVFVEAINTFASRSVEGQIRSTAAKFAMDENPIAVAVPDIHVRYMYNPSLKRGYSSIPGLMMLIFILVNTIVLGTSINREKTQGSWRLLSITRLGMGRIVLGKTIPFIVISFLHIAMLYGVGRLFDIEVVGSMALFFLIQLLYIGCCMSLGILIAAWFDRPLDVLIISWVVLFIPNVFLSGFIFPLSAMDAPVRQIAQLLPGASFIGAFRNIAFKGSGLIDNLPQIATLSVEIILALVCSIPGFKRTVPR